MYVRTVKRFIVRAFLLLRLDYRSDGALHYNGREVHIAINLMDAAQMYANSIAGP